jgi:N-acetylneuraminic acid mutarotase
MHMSGDQSIELETLEARQHFATDIKINFQPASASTPSGYIVDAGRTYGSRNGQTYGWSSDNQSAVYDRNSSRSPDQRYDTLARMNGKSWNLKLSAGWYDVDIYVGDAANHDAVYKITTEGKLAVFTQLHYPEKYFGEGHIKLYVSDGKLTLTSASGSKNNAIDFIHVRSSSAPPSSAYKGDLKWSQSSSVNSPISRVESGIVQVGTKIYFMGGYSSSDYKSVTSRVDILDIKSNTWSRGTSLPGSQTHAGAATDGRYIYWVAGQKGPLFARGGTSESWRYDTQNKTWSKYVSLPSVRFGGALAYEDGYLYYVGGDTSDRYTASTVAWKLNTKLSSPHWETIASLPRAADHVGHAVLNGKLYIFGGEHDHGNSYVQHTDVYAYDIDSNSWSKKANLPTASSHFEGNVVVQNNKIWLFGGQIDAQQLTSEVRSYDPSTNTWTRHNSMPEKRKGGASWYNNGKFYYLTGDASGKGQPKYALTATFV